MKRLIISTALLLVPLPALHAAEYFVSTSGTDANPGTERQPHTGDIWKFQLRDAPVFQTLYENGVRLHKARFPNRRQNSSLSSACGDYLRTESGSPKLEDGGQRSWAGYSPRMRPPPPRRRPR